MNYTKEGYCLGNSCRFYKEKPDAICFKQGVLPRCSPALKQARMKLDDSSPDMHEALKEIVSDLTDIGDCRVTNHSFNLAQQALAKAEGK